MYQTVHQSNMYQTVHHSIWKTLIPAMFLILMFPFYIQVREGALRGLLLWYNSVVPSLFPFMVMTDLLITGGDIQMLMKPFRNLPGLLSGPVSGLSPDGFCTLLCGLLCGCPMGAKTCADLAAENRLHCNEARFLLAVCNHPSPMFLLGYLYPRIAPWIPLHHLLICIYLPLLPISILAKRLYPFDRRDVRNPEFLNSGRENRSPVSRTVNQAIMSSFETLFRIAGCMILCSVLGSVVDSCSALTPSVKAVLAGILEITTGIDALASLPEPAFVLTGTCCAFSFGGLSALLQTYGVLQNRTGTNDAFPAQKKTGLSIRSYFFWKLFHAALTALLVLFYVSVYGIRYKIRV